MTGPRDRARAWDGDRGEIPAQLVWMGVIVALAIAAGAVITSLVMAKANSINLQ